MVGCDGGCSCFVGTAVSYGCLKGDGGLPSALVRLSF